MKHTSSKVPETKPARDTAPRWAFIHPETYARLDAFLGAHAGDPEYRLLCAYLLRTAPDESTTLVPLPFDIINEIRGCKARETGTLELVERFCADIGTSYEAHVAPRKGEKGLVRRVDVRFLGSKPKPPHNLRDVYVHAVTGLPRSAYRVLSPSLPGAREAQRHVMKHYRALPQSLYRMYRGPFENALARIHDDAGQVQLLEDCAEGRPEYRLSKDDSTERLYAPGWSNLDSDARHRLMPHWLELDLRCAYLAISVRVAHTNGVAAPLMQLVVAAADPWAEACRLSGVPPEQRQALKNVTNPALFGAGERTLLEKLGDLPPSFLDSPFLSEVRAVYRQLCDKALRRGFVVGMKNRFFLEVPKGTSALQRHRAEEKFRSLLHRLCSEYELCMIDACYDVAELEHFRKADCYVAAYQYDGVAVDAPEERRRDFVAACKDAVGQRARALGVSTMLVEKYAPFRLNMSRAVHDPDYVSVYYDEADDLAA